MHKYQVMLDGNIIYTGTSSHNANETYHHGVELIKNDLAQCVTLVIDGRVLLSYSHKNKGGSK